MRENVFKCFIRFSLNMELKYINTQPIENSVSHFFCQVQIEKTEKKVGKDYKKISLWYNVNNELRRKKEGYFIP